MTKKATKELGETEIKRNPSRKHIRAFEKGEAITKIK